MAWMLQPHNMSQAIRPNLYRVAYRRTGAYKGMGDDVPFPWADTGIVPPPCLPTGSMGPLSPGQVWCETNTGSPPPYPFGADPATSATATLSNWVQQNAGLVAIGALVLVVFLSSRR